VLLWEVLIAALAVGPGIVLTGMQITTEASGTSPSKKAVP